MIKIFLLINLIFLGHIDCFAKVFISACSPNPDSIKRAIKHANFLRVKDDKIKEESGCIEVLTVKERENLYVKYLKIKVPNLSINNSSNIKGLKNCNLRLIKVIHSNTNRTNIDHRSKSISLLQLDKKSLKKEEMSIIMLDDKQSSININNEDLFITCKILKNGYNIELHSSSENFSILNSFYINFGGYKNIGSYNKVDNNQNKKIQIVNNHFRSKAEKIKMTLFLKALY